MVDVANHAHDGEASTQVTRWAARAIILDDDGRLLTIRRTVVGREQYWVLPGGGVEDVDTSREATMHREVMEELGARVRTIRRVLTYTQPRHRGLELTEHAVFLTRLVSLDLTLRNGPEFQNPERGAYDLDPVSLRDPAAAAAPRLEPAVLRAFVLDHRESLLTEAGLS